MADGQQTPQSRPEVRPPAPHLDGPLGSSGAAPVDLPPAASDPAPDRYGVRPETPAGGPDPLPPGPTARAAENTTPAPRASEARPAEPAAETTTSSAPRTTTDQAEPGTATPGEATATPSQTTPSAAPGETKPSTATPGQTTPGTATPGQTAPGGAAVGVGQAGGGKAGEVTAEAGQAVVVTVGSSSGRRVTRVLRRANPVRIARTAGRSTSAWAKRPTGRLVIPAVIGVLLVGAAGTAGAYLVPEALPPAPTTSATPGFPLGGAAPGASAPSAGGSAPVVPGAVSGPTAPAMPGVGGARPADALANWAQGVGTRVGIPVVAVQAYGYAELVAERTAPNCHLSWTTIAAIARVESAHGSANGAVLGADGSVQPPIFGLPLDGKGGRQEIRDTDRGVLDGDSTYDRAVGPLQFIPQTWEENKVDADNDGAANPNDIDDAALAAAMYLCKGGRDVSKADGWWDAILSYNAVRPYAQKVFDAANEYGRRSRV